MKIFTRIIQKVIENSLFKGDMIVIYGPRQAGKTTLSKTLISSYGDFGVYYDCQHDIVRRHFIIGNPDALLPLINGKKIVVFDEAQTIFEIGSILKIFHDKYKHLGVQIIATGSSSFDLANKIIEPMTGRAREFKLLPLSIQEIKSVGIKIDREKLLEILLYGSYPEVISANSIEDKQMAIKKISTNYLYKDIFILESIKRPKAFEDLLRMLAMQMGQSINISEIARSIGINRGTVEKYISLLEQSFVIKRVYPYSKNLRNEIKKSYKVYFLDQGVRNVLVDIINTDIDNRNDKGVIFEGFVFNELLKKEQCKIFQNDLYFWRTKQGLEIDFVEKEGQNLIAIECKYSGDDRYKFNKFVSEYKNNVIGTKIVSIYDYIEN